MNRNQAEGSEGKYTVAEVPPEVGSQRRSQWVALFEECRVRPGEWRRARRSFAQSSAAQLASDVRSAAHRDPASMRIRGLGAGEVWESKWAPLPDGSAPGRFGVWLRFMGVAAGDTGGLDEASDAGAAGGGLVDPSGPVAL